MTKRVCCNLECKKEATFSLKEYDEHHYDYTECCDEHLSSMLYDGVFVVEKIKAD